MMVRTNDIHDALAAKECVGTAPAILGVECCWFSRLGVAISQRSSAVGCWGYIGLRESNLTVEWLLVAICRSEEGPMMS